MPRYIDVENYCKTICRCNGEACDKNKCPIWNAPTADVEPVRHGRWKDGNCSVCSVPAVTMRQGDGVEFRVETPRCPNCGAKMDAKEDEHEAD